LVMYAISAKDKGFMRQYSHFGQIWGCVFGYKSIYYKNNTTKAKKMAKLKGVYKDTTFTLTPLSGWETDSNEIKCNIEWADGRSDFIWFNDTGTELVCQLNHDIRVAYVEVIA